MRVKTTHMVILANCMYIITIVGVRRRDIGKTFEDAPLPEMGADDGQNCTKSTLRFACMLTTTQSRFPISPIQAQEAQAIRYSALWNQPSITDSPFRRSHTHQLHSHQ
jgi:hypothetical protein